jgi:hypothetical protein
MFEQLSKFFHDVAFASHMKSASYAESRLSRQRRNTHELRA